MNILALDTSMGACSAAVLRTDGAERTLFVRQEAMARGHAEALMPMVAETSWPRAALPFAELDVIAATTGPGSFTGVRIAIAAARGLALVTGARLFGTDSLTVMAQGARRASRSASRSPWRSMPGAACSISVSMTETARKLEGPLLHRAGRCREFASGDASHAPSAAAPLLSPKPRRDAALRIAARLPELQPSAAALAELAEESGETLPTLRPLYLRPPDAKPQAQAVAVRR